MSMMRWIREQAHHLLAAATWEMMTSETWGEAKVGPGKRGKAEVWVGGSGG